MPRSALWAVQVLIDRAQEGIGEGTGYEDLSAAKDILGRLDELDRPVAVDARFGRSPLEPLLREDIARRQPGAD